MALTTSSGEAGTRPDAAAKGAGSLTTAWMLLLFGLVGLVASFALTVESFAVVADPDYVPECSVNPVINCAASMQVWQSELFGFPNAILGVLGFPVVAATGAAMLAGGRMKTWYWTGLWLGALGAFGFMHWLIYQSLINLESLCPYCLVVWVATTPVFAAISGYAIPRGALGGPVARNQLLGDLLALRWWLVGLWFLVVTGLIAVFFWDYWRTLL